MRTRLSTLILHNYVHDFHNTSRSGSSISRCKEAQAYFNPDSFHQGSSKPENNRFLNKEKGLMIRAPC